MKSFIIILLFSLTNMYSSAKKIPKELLSAYTLNGKIPVRNHFFDKTNENKLKIYTENQIISFLKDIKIKKTNYYGKTDNWLYNALEKYSIINKKVAVIGSQIPWYEAVIIAYGGIPYTVEYNPRISQDTRINILSVEEFEKSEEMFDIILSISSLEHDGLGRYGDPLNPVADLTFMKKIQSKLNKKGLFILSFPVGADCLVWNAHRIYGPIRLELLFKEWNLIDQFGFSKKLFSKPLGTFVQPIFILQKKP